MDRHGLGLAGVMPHATASLNIFENMPTDWFARDGVARSPWCSAETCERSISLSPRSPRSGRMQSLSRLR